MSASGRGPDCCLQGAGCRTAPVQVRMTRRPPHVCDVRADRLRVCGGCYIRLGRGKEPGLMAAVRGHAQLATPFVSRKRPRQEDAGDADADAGAGSEGEIGKDADTFVGFVHGVTRVYGEGPCPATSGWRQDAHCRRPRESKAARRKGRRQQPDIFAGERYAAKPKQRRGGDGGAGVVAALVSQISGAPTRTAKRVPVECAGRKKGEAKIRGPPSERAVRVYRRWL